MNTVLLNSKVHAPIGPQEKLPRSRLQGGMESAVERHKLILVSAPAGYGKTTFLAGWAETTHLPVAWLSISSEDGDVERFMRYLLSAWEVVQPEIIQTPLGILLGSLSPDIPTVLSEFLNAADRARPGLAFVLDDYHLVQDPAIHEAVTFLLDHLPPRVHFILSSRSEPPLPLARYRARRELFELRLEDLQFTYEESAAFLSQSTSVELSSDAVSSLYSQTEGWAAGLQLAALTLRLWRQHHGSFPARQWKAALHRGLPGSEVLARLPAGEQDFLLKTSILDRLCGPLCDAVTGATGGQAILETFERNNLFIIPLDNEREWFRYHSLFAEFLQGELHRRLPGAVDRLHNQAARWYLAHDLPELAFHHAVAGNSVELVIKIFNDYSNAKLLSGEMKVVEHWLSSLPAEWITAYPVLNLMRAGFLAYTGAIEACVRCVDEVEQRLLPVENEDQRWQMARVTAVRCLMACRTK